MAVRTLVAPALVALLIPIGSAGTACVSNDARTTLLETDERRFAEEVYPLLLRDCAMSECHGAPTRFFRVVGPGRVRLSEHTEPLEAATDEELELTYERARSMLDPSPEASLLLRKPLAAGAGGASHEGEDRFGRNVYRTKQDPAYRTLVRWVASAERER